MASIISYIGGIRVYRENEDQLNQIPSGVHLWDGDKGFVENIVKYNVDDQLRCILDQAIALAYYVTFYGMRCHDLVNEFIREFVTYVNGQFMTRATGELKQTAKEPLLKDVAALTYYIKEGIWKKDINVALVKEYLDARPYDVTPSAWFRDIYTGEHQSDYVPFLMWKNRSVSHIKSETTDVKLGLTSFKFSHTYQGNYINLATHSYPIGTSFSSELASNYENKVPILDYLAHFNVADRTFEGIVGAIGDMCLHLDIRRSGLTSTQRLAACIASNIFRCGCINGSCSNIESEAERYKYDLFNAVTSYLEFAHKTYGIEVKDRNILGSLLYCIADTKERKDSARYIREQGGSASADDLASFNKTLGSLEALQFISQSNTLLSAQSQVTAEDANSKETDKNTKPESTKSDTNNQSAAEEDDRDDEAEEDDSSEDNAPDTSKDDTTDDNGDKDFGDADQGTGSGDGETDAPGGGSDATGADMPPDDEPEPQPNTSDNDGVKFEVVNPEGETTDSVMFREEVNTFISNILANPPEDISPQNLATLSELQLYWLYSLSIETIMGILGSCTKQLPESLTKLNTQCGVTNNE